MEPGLWIETPEESTGFISTVICWISLPRSCGNWTDAFRSKGDPGVQATLIWTANLEGTVIERSNYSAIGTARRNRQSRGHPAFAQSYSESLGEHAGEGVLGYRNHPMSKCHRCLIRAGLSVGVAHLIRVGAMTTPTDGIGVETVIRGGDD